MKCFEVQQNLVAFLHNELDRKEMMEIHAHLGQCDNCFVEETEIKKTLNLLDKHPYFTLPEHFESQLDQKIKKSIPKKGGFPKKLRQFIYPIAATIVIIFGLEFLIFLVYTNSRQPDSLYKFRTTGTIFKSVSSVNSPEGVISNELINRYLQRVQSEDTQ